MAPTFDEVRVLLIQARTHHNTIQEERQTFVKRCRLRSDQLDAITVFTHQMEPSVLVGYDAVFIGGAGALSAYKEYDWMPDLLALVRYMVDENIPLFGSCWGHQVIARALGGRVINDPDRTEIGCFSVELTKAGRKDELFSRFPHTFKANQGHQDRVDMLPQSAIELALSEIAPFQAFRISDKPVYGTQFHSELDKETEKSRLLTYRDYYPHATPPEKFQEILDSLEDTPEVDRLLHEFLLLFAVESHPISKKVQHRQK